MSATKALTMIATKQATTKPTTAIITAKISPTTKRSTTENLARKRPLNTIQKAGTKIDRGVTRLLPGFPVRK